MHRIHALVKVLLMVGVFLVAGCSSTGIIKEMTVSPEMQKENLPVRTLRTYVAYDNTGALGEIKRVLQETSDLLEKLIGVKLEPAFAPLPIEWKDRGRVALVNQVYDTSIPYSETFDIAVGFTERTGGETLGCFLGCWLAATDDTYRRFIIIKEFHPWFLAHEIGHTLIISRLHAESGLMKARIFPVVPGAYILSEGDHYFAPEDRAEALRNKWRKFGEKVAVPEPEDCIGGCK